MNDVLTEAFKELRRAWFNAYLRRRPHERGGESESDEELRQENNRNLKGQFDEQTEQIIAGGTSVPVSPRCVNDLGKKP